MVKNVFIRLLVGCVLLFVVCTSKAFGQENIKRIKDNYRSMLISPANVLITDIIGLSPPRIANNIQGIDHKSIGIYTLGTCFFMKLA